MGACHYACQGRWLLPLRVHGFVGTWVCRLAEDWGIAATGDSNQGSQNETRISPACLVVGCVGEGMGEPWVSMVPVVLVHWA